MLKNTYHAGQYITCWTIHTMLDNTYPAASSHVFVARFIDFPSLYDFDIYFGIVPTVWNI
jgi:hypothetical protein